jgi:trehalose/maltose transport system substrate-binding protein
VGVFASFLILYCIFGLAGCRLGSRKPVTLTILDPEWSQPDELPRAQRHAQEFTDKTGISLKHFPVPETSLGQLDLLRSLLKTSASSPDVVGIDVIWPGLLADSLVDMRPALGKELSTLDPELIAGYTVNGKVLAAPYHAHVGVLQYRTDLLREYGFTVPPQTWVELEMMAARIQAGERAKGKRDFWGYAWQGAANEGLTCNALEWQASEGGGRIIEDDQTISVNNPATIRAWERAARWVGTISPPGVVAYRELDSMNAWDAGNVAFRRTWQWEYRMSHWKESGITGNSGFTSMPGGAAGRFGTLGGIGLGVTRYSVHPKDAMSLVHFLISRESQPEGGRAGDNGHPPMIELPAIIDPYSEPAQPNPKRGRVVTRPSNVTGPAYEAVTRAYFEAVHAVLVGEKKAPEAAAELEKELVGITGFKKGPPKKLE